MIYFVMTNISRRNVLKFSSLLAASVFVETTTTKVLANANASETSVVSPDQALRRLIEGNARYTTGQLTHPRQTVERINEVAKGQKPFAIVLGCADSRVAPEILFDEGLGDLFVVRIAGNIATSDVIGSIEFAVAEFGVPLVMVLGHERCGAVKATVEALEKNINVPGYVGTIARAIAPVVEATKEQPGDLVDNVVMANASNSAKRLQQSLVLSKAIKAGKLKIVPAYYDLDTGAVKLV
jgi:carbonic anhydrase